MKLGVLSLGSTAPDPVSGRVPSTTERFEEVLRLAELAEESGLDYFGFGEHHAGRTVASAPPVVLAAVAARTQRIGLISTVTLLSTLDPVRVAEDYATVDQLSHGRVEVIIGKGNSADPYPLFGYDREHQWELLAEHHGLLRRLWRDEPVTFTGRFRGPLREVTTLPRPTRVPPIWHGVATSLHSPELAARHGEPIFVANAIQPLENYARLVDHYRRVWAEQGHDPAAARVGCGGQLYIGRSSQAARSELRPYYEALWSDRDPTRDRGGIGDEPSGTTLEDHVRDGGLFTGSPAEVIDKIGRYHERLGQDTMIFGVELGGLPPARVADSLFRFAEEVAPALRAL
ncbi:LLM class flavin-dependent oxidoreductase [Actinoalloteichus hymeniacidonis]|uniref:Luciferase-like monooxygenase n=1 Tax=Actinoalloteichus hymeniacidonis TaxID=340345 RepID=A0AAC9HRV8_9PSEU|nr:LLM class flavin-dependent oxidoreductase [Actinoalloteichus hymeniacidonis]AOS63365.1 Luciferase-like monooxygenase [Actinoalloteichus hymeniacidonis]MBB5908595.1 alkanesulfonate monooxygenase SsuD/methylene tetrahydromethanopterin reductase-like flavin-dependent oxidoreductase (luciferase family) [Actinoalloteichus hymeniacidonis]